MKVSVQHAQGHFADILTAIDTGEEVELTRPGRPSVRLILLGPAPAKDLTASNGKRILGAGVGELRVPSFEAWQASDSEPTPTPTKRPRAELLYAGEGLITLPTDEEWRAMDKELEEEMLNGPIFPPEHV